MTFILSRSPHPPAPTAGRPAPAAAAVTAADDEILSGGPRAGSRRPATARGPLGGATAGLVSARGRASAPRVGKVVHPAPARLFADVPAVAIAGFGVGMAPLTALGFVALVAVGLVVFRTYRRRLVLSVLDDLPGIVGATGLALLVIALLLGEDPRVDSLLRAGALTVTTLVVGRAAAYAVVVRSRRRNGGVPTAIVGGGPIAVELSEHLRGDPRVGLRPVGFVAASPADDEASPVGYIDDLELMSTVHGVTAVIVAFGPGQDRDLVALLRAAMVLGLELYVVPRFFELGATSGGSDAESIRGIPLHRMRPAAVQRWSWRTKRVIDITVAALALVVLAPVLGLLTALVRCSSPGPILFRQERVGQFGRHFELLKFRTMQVNPGSDITWSVEDDDPRLTCGGIWMRRLSLDELPQLWNVVRGDMSLVGPRPERPHYVDRFSSEVAGYGDRHRLPPGITGLAQVCGLRGDTSIDHRARFDNAYIEHWSPWLDVKVVLRTFAAVRRELFAHNAGG